MGLIELKPCPFCGGKAGLYHTHDGRSCVQCDECGISTLRKMDARLAIQMWNKRDGEKKNLSPNCKLKSPNCPHCGAKMEGVEKNENGN